MKIYLRDQENFHPETVAFYKQHFDVVDNNFQEKDLIVINDFREIVSDIPVACNSTGIDHIQAPEIISLQGEDLSDLKAVAELSIGMAIYCMRIFKGEEVRGKTLGIIGYGRIGKHLADFGEKLGMKVHVYDLVGDDKIAYTPLGEVMKCDIVSLNISSTEENRGWFTKGHLECMKDGAIFLNAARPWLVNQEDLYWALENKLAGAWVDFNLPFAENLITTPHLGGATKESKQKSELIIAKKLLEKYGTK